MDSKRIFIAFDISNVSRSAAVEHAAGLRRMFPYCRVSWTKAANLHFTLRFLGDVDVRRLEAVCGAVDACASRSQRFRICVSGTGAFPNARKARVLWLGADGNLQAVTQVKDELERALDAIGFEREQRHFAPHLTLARLKDPTSCRDLIENHLRSAFKTPQFEVNEIAVYESKLSPAGSIYSVVRRSQLNPLDSK